jgi:hypothetical protein
MPLYTWKDEVTGTTVDVQRVFSQSDEKPLEAELPEEKRVENPADRKWSKVIGVPRVAKGPGWGGKGRW